MKTLLVILVNFTDCWGGDLKLGVKRGAEAKLHHVTQFDFSNSLSKSRVLPRLAQAALFFAL